MFVQIPETDVKDQLGREYHIFDFAVFPINNKLVYSVVIGCDLTNDIHTLFVMQIFPDGTIGQLVLIQNVTSAMCVYPQSMGNQGLLKARLGIIDNWQFIKLYVPNGQ